MSKNKVTQESLEVSTDYGIISAKVWNSQTKNCKRILAIHGWMDNAGSFDKLVPLLEHPEGIYLLAIDLPGHGRSSQLPKGVPYNDLTFIASMRYFIRKLEWNQRSHSNDDEDKNEEAIKAEVEAETSSISTKDKYILMGHSLGAGLSLFYASLYPEDLEQVIFLDFLKAPSLPTPKLLQQLSCTIDKLNYTTITASSATITTSTGTTVYTDQLLASLTSQGPVEHKIVQSQELAISALVHAHQAMGHLGRDDALCLFKRSSIAVPNQPSSYFFMRDSRMPYLLNYRDHKEPNIHYGLGFRNHAVLIVGKRGLFDPRKKHDPYTDSKECVVEGMKKLCKTFHLFWLDGCDHYLHMSNPGYAAEIINQSLLEPGNIDPI